MRTVQRTRTPSDFQKRKNLEGKKKKGEGRKGNSIEMSRTLSQFCHNFVTMWNFDQILFVKWSILFAFRYIASFE